MKRRDFVQQSSLTGGALLLTPWLPRLDYTEGKRIGVQLYSVRDDFQSDPLKVLQRVGEIGYTEVEGYGYNEGEFFGLTPLEFQEGLKNSGLKMPAMHHSVSIANWDDRNKQLNDDLKRTIDTFSAMGVEMVICPLIIKSQRDLESVKKLSNIFNLTGELCGKNGMTFGYHNHDFEFESEGVLYNLLLQRTDPKLVQFELDIYWAVYAGQDPLVWMKKAGGRITSLHVKDMAPGRETVEVGEGNIDFASIFAAPEAASVKYFFVELEDYKRTPMEGIEVSLKNLNKLLGNGN